ncbi:MAG: HutD family protein [Bdellovibrionia bacterium]
MSLHAQVISRDQYKRASWKNGLGYTDEIAIYPENASLQRGDFVWRLSSARIEKASPFSEFPYHDRTLVILQGTGVRLYHTYEPGEEPEQVELTPLEPYDFPGDVPSRCELISGGVTDLSVFVRKAEAEAMTEVRAVDDSEPLDWGPSGRWNFAYAADGSFEVLIPGQSDVIRVSEGETLRVEVDSPLMDGEAVRWIGAGVLVFANIQG